eukprot:9613604-Ditylum_brightwellii.AAC.1
MDTFAKGLRNAAKMKEDALLSNMVKNRYKTFDYGFGKRLEDGELTLDDCEAYVLDNGEPELTSGKQELYEMILNRYTT